MILSIDPGLKGALAWITDDGHLIDVEDMPVIKSRGKQRINGAEVLALMRLREIDGIVIEEVGPHRGEGVAGAFSFGKGAGILEGAALSIGCSLHMVTPAVWKRRAGVPREKDGARLMASRMWPGASEKFRRVKDDGRAESALLGRWAVLGGISI